MVQPKINLSERAFLTQLASKGVVSRLELRKMGIYGSLLTKLLKYDILTEDIDNFGIIRYKVNDEFIRGGT